jgi:hypothetical protein
MNRKFKPNEEVVWFGWDGEYRAGIISGIYGESYGGFQRYVMQLIHCSRPFPYNLVVVDENTLESAEGAFSKHLMPDIEHQPE